MADTISAGDAINELEARRKREEQNYREALAYRAHIQKMLAEAVSSVEGAERAIATTDKSLQALKLFREVQ